jgi:hypothetical protein
MLHQFHYPVVVNEEPTLSVIMSEVVAERLLSLSIAKANFWRAEI